MLDCDGAGESWTSQGMLWIVTMALPRGPKLNPTRDVTIKQEIIKKRTSHHNESVSTSGWFVVWRHISDYRRVVLKISDVARLTSHNHVNRLPIAIRLVYGAGSTLQFPCLDQQVHQK